jgi:polar amino acid transport system permease protein
MVKDTALVSLISIADISFQAQQLRGFTYDSLRIYTIALVMYFAISMALTGVRKAIEMKLAAKYGPIAGGLA